MAAQTKAYQQQQRATGIRVALFVAFGIAMFGLGLAFQPMVNWVQAREPKAAAEKYVNYVITGNYAAAYAMMSSEQKEQKTQEQFVESVKNVVSTDPKYVNPLFDSGPTVATYSVTVENLNPVGDASSTTGVVLVTMAYEDNSWKVDGVSVL